MITKIKGKGFICPPIDQDCKEKMIFVGSNRSGKTTRCNIIHLCLNSFVATAHKVCKKPHDILEHYAKGDSLTCAIEINETEFEFYISRNSEGKVSKRFRVDKKKHSEKEYMQELALAGNPRIIDLSSFIQMSDEKKIDQLFKLYPANVDIKKLNSYISIKEDGINRINSDIKALKTVIQQNTKSKQNIELPAGTLADIEEELENHKTAYRTTRDKIAGLKAIIDKSDKKEPEIDEKAEVKGKTALDNQKKNHPQCFENDIPKDTFPGPEEKSSGQEWISSKKESLEKILKVMEETDCQICTAAMVCKQEIRKIT